MLEVRNLTVISKNQTLISNVSFKLEPGKVIGLTGASGSGKTTIIKAIMGVLPSDCKITEGEILLDGEELIKLSSRKHRNYCGTVLGFIPQLPMTAFDSYKQIGTQMIETFRFSLHISKLEAERLAKKELIKVNLTDVKRILNSYPRQLSGGMLQRVTMALLSGMNPRYILADEPTAALDEENRDNILKLLKNQYKKSGILFVSHDIKALQFLCSEMNILAEKTIVEKGTVSDILKKPKEKWTKEFVYSLREERGGEWEWMDFK